MLIFDDDELVSPEVKAQIDAFTEQWPNAEWGPAHIVLSDYNLTDGHIQWCKGLIRAVITREAQPDDLDLLTKLDWYAEHSIEELQATDAFLDVLLAIPEDDR